MTCSTNKNRPNFGLQHGGLDDIVGILVEIIELHTNGFMVETSISQQCCPVPFEYEVCPFMVSVDDGGCTS